MTDSDQPDKPKGAPPSAGLFVAPEPRMLHGYICTVTYHGTPSPARIVDALEAITLKQTKNAA
jgi:hypothetical protein